MKTTASLKITSSVLGVLALAGCGKISGLESITTEVTAQSGSGEKSRYDVNLYPLNKVVCDPWGGGGSGSPQKGVKASLFYRGADQPRYYLSQE